MTDERDEIRSRIDIVELVSQTVNLKKVGKQWTGLCPFHADKNPSFYVSPDMQRYTCWSCGEKGDIFTFVMKTQHVDFPEALALLAQRAGVKLTKRARDPGESSKTQNLQMMEEALKFFRAELEKSELATSYCTNRGLTKDVLNLWEMGYAPDVGEALAVHLRKKDYKLSDCKALFLVEEDRNGGYYDKFRGRLMFPIRDERGDLVAFGGRIIGDGQPKYINSSDTSLYRKSRVLYGLHQAREFVGKEKVAVLTEGYLDTIACHSAGVRTAIASLGTALSEEHARLLKRWCEAVTVLYDSDEAGEKAAGRAVEVLRAEGIEVRVALMPKGEDPDTLLRKAGAAAVQQAAAGGMTPLDYKMRMLEGRYSLHDEAFWSEAMTALAEAPSDIERSKHVARLSGMYPGMRDPVAAQRAIRTQVARIRRQMRVRPGPGAAPVAAPSLRAGFFNLEPAEAAIFGAVLSDDLRASAFTHLSDTELFVTELGSRLAAGLVATFPEPPTGRPSEWLHHLEDEELRDALAGAELVRVNEVVLSDSVARLQRKRTRREVQKLREQGAGDDDRLREINERLRKEHETEDE